MQTAPPPADLILPPPPRAIAFVETFQGIAIHRDEMGFYGANGADDFGYTWTVDELREEIAEYWCCGGSDATDIGHVYRVVSA